MRGRCQTLKNINLKTSLEFPNPVERKCNYLKHYFLPKYRQQLLKVDDIMNRKQLDLHGLLFESVADMYNNEIWVPESATSQIFDHRLTSSHKLYKEECRRGETSLGQL